MLLGFLLICLSCLSHFSTPQQPSDLAPGIKMQSPQHKYFNDKSHRDTRFSSETFSVNNRTDPQALSRLLKSYLATLTDLDVTTWLAHDTLLGWHWNRTILPGATGFDMHVSLSGLSFLSHYYNMTVYTFQFHDNLGVELNVEYLLDVNSQISERVVGRLDENRVDARWIDMQSGIFIDITALRIFDRHAAEHGMPRLLQSKDGHIYHEQDVLPLEKSVLEGQYVFVPRNAWKLLVSEYGESVAAGKILKGRKFDETPQDPLSA